MTIELPEKKAFHINDHVSYFYLYVQVTSFVLISILTFQVIVKEESLRL